MDSVYDEEFGSVRIKRIARAKYIRLRVRHDGSLSLTLPKRTGLNHARALINDSRDSIRELLLKKPLKRWAHGDPIGATHRLVLVEDETAVACKTTIQGNRAIVRHNPRTDPSDVQMAIHGLVLKLLRKQASAYLPRRLAMLAERFGFSYERVRFSNAETRWGSCSSSGTISVNIWLMTLPLEIIDYVLVHELSHTKHMDHSQSFWRTVMQCSPNYRELRGRLKEFNPTP